VHKKVLLRISQILQQLTKNYFNLEVLISTVTVAATETLLAPWMEHLLIHEKLLSTDYGMRGKKRKEKKHPLDHRWIPHQGVTQPSRICSTFLYLSSGSKLTYTTPHTNRNPNIKHLQKHRTSNQAIQYLLDRKP
jgi:hypothetical protein